MRLIGNEIIDMAEPLWRYFKTNRFLELLQTSSLYFASARQFKDKFEGAVKVLPHGCSFDQILSSKNQYEWAFEELRRLTKVNCWHRSEYESDAMWHLYSETGKGVAICTNAKRIQAAAKPFRLKPEYGFEELWAGNVKYINLLQERLGGGFLDRFWYKHLAFSWEREFRLAVSIRTAEEFGVDVPELGVQVEFDISQLIESIYLGPSLSDEDIGRIFEAAKHYGLEDRINVTSLLGTPIYN